MNPALPGTIHFGREVCGDLLQAERREWWLSNGLGAYAAGNIAGTLTRRYHGLLIAPIQPPLGRVLVFAKADATVIDGDRERPLFTNRWSDGVVDPQGHRNVESFHLEGRMPVWRFAFGGIRLEYRVWMEPGVHRTYLAYRLLSDAEEIGRRLRLRLKLLINARDHHGNAHAGAFHPIIESRNGQLQIEQPDGFTLHLHACGGGIEPDHTWYERFDLLCERKRGLPADDAHLCAGEADLELRPGEWAGIAAALEAPVCLDLEEAMRRFQAHDEKLLQRSRLQVPALRSAPEWIDQLVLAADSFLFHRSFPERSDGLSVIAGYPWFDEWGRDAMIALPGLTLATGRYDQALRILQAYGRCIDQGMLPNTLAATGDARGYNSADAALWFIEAWRAYLECVPNQAALEKAFPLLEELIDRHVKGTRHGIGVDAADGLLHAGEAGLQVTWMDAKVGDWVVTPRIGKPVEINALWYNALRTMSLFAQRLGLAGSDYIEQADKARTGFQHFINPANGGLFDVLDGPEAHDDAVRPNQIFAISLPFSPLDRNAQAGVIRLCRRELLTSYGLRSLSPADPRYRPRYRGGVLERDGAYHQGTVWAWLLGHYALAEYRVHGNTHAALSLLEPLRDHLIDAGLGTVSEIFDGDPPHTPRGCPAQAWSVGCVLEAWWRLSGTLANRSSYGDEAQITEKNHFPICETRLLSAQYS
jgi:predicted glycogen debranching enzyme